MVSIIRSPEISDQKRKLASRRLPAAHAVEIGSAQISTMAPVRAVSPVPVQPQVSPQFAIDQEVKRQVEQARLALQADAKAQVDSALEQARKQGLAEGRQAGAEQARQAAAVELERFQSIAAKLHGALEAGIRGTEDVAVEIAFAAVCKMLGDAASSKEGVRALVHQAATHAIHTEQMVVRLHAGDLATLREAGALDADLPSGAAVSWVADKAVELGGCVLETDGGELDARLETQFERLRATLLAAR